MSKSLPSLAILLLSLAQTAPLLAQSTRDGSDKAKSSSAISAPDAVVVSQGGAHVTLKDVDGFAEALPWDQRATVFSDPNRIERILRNLLLTKQLVKQAQSDGLDSNAMVRAGMELASKQALAKAQVQAFKEKTQQSIPDMTELARERYLANPEAFAVPASTDVKHILISTKDRSDAKAKALADKIHAALMENPDQFADDVAKYSDDDSKKGNHGLIKDATSGQYVDNFRNAAKKLTRVGQISEPVKTQYGYHILKAVKLHPASQPTFAEVRNGLVKQLQDDYVKKQVQDYVDGLKSKELEPNPDAIASLRTRFAGDNAPASTSGSN
ncbi:MAG: peptidylprolyl isomerase [Rhodanobacteraceae bacterium]